MTVVAIVNQKGGVGKTTLATNLAWSLATKERVLLLEPIPRGALRTGPMTAMMRLKPYP